LLFLVKVVIFEANLEYTFTRCEKYSSKLDISRLFLRIFVRLIIETMKKIYVLTCLLLACSLTYADSLERFINRYKEKEGAECRVLNRDYHFNDVPDGTMSPEAQRLLSGTMVLMGVEEWMTLKLDQCKESTRERFVDRVIDAVPSDYALLKEKGYRSVYANNAEEEYAYLVIVDSDVAAPSLTRLYVTNAFMRAIMNDEGTGIDEEKFSRYLDGLAEGLEKSLRGLGETLESGTRRLEKWLQERAKELEKEYNGIYDI